MSAPYWTTSAILRSCYPMPFYECQSLKIRKFERYQQWGPSQWPCGLRHELSSLARRLGSWVRISPKEWMSVTCIFVLCVCYSACRYRPCDGLIPCPRSPTTVYSIKKLKSGQGPTKGCRARVYRISTRDMFMATHAQRFINKLRLGRPKGFTTYDLTRHFLERGPKISGNVPYLEPYKSC
jgi:hypothetical protein